MPDSETKSPATSDDLFAMLERLCIETKTVEHPPLHTVEESQKLRGDIAGGHSKNLFLKDKKGALYLVVAEEEATVDLKRLHGVIGSARLSFGKPDLLMEVLGVVPGSVTPFALINDGEARVQPIFDERLMAHDPVNFHPLRNDATTSIASADLLAFARATGHEPRIMSLETASD
jgi:Ala-tRNA(Pro) deacylase